ncbi:MULTISPECIES: UbiA family prenyltransferase [Natrialbaceae]|uniref:UbiA family prenyltransferase n=1 Tax=Natrialbaceae TaxID=1644061 RepID=UPI00207C3D71|nr:UbiA family prenyltransferase [Natronococcus sp. CG52]
MSKSTINVFSRSLVGYASLVRLPNLFTAPPDIVVGLAIATASGYAISTSNAIAIGIASICLYAAGTTFNDYFDVSEDLRFRPERPIPAGEVSRQEALLLGSALLIGGILIAFTIAEAVAGVVAVCLAVTILLYDGLFKGSTAGFLLMGASRGLNVLLGITAAVSPSKLSAWEFVVPAIVVTYIAAVTFLGESETGESDGVSVLVTIIGVVVASAGVIGLLVARSPPFSETSLTILLLISFLIWTGRALKTAYTDPSPSTIGHAVGTCVLGLVILNAAFAATVDFFLGIITLSFFIPAIGLSGKFDVS